MLGSPSWYRCQKYPDLKIIRAKHGVGRRLETHWWHPPGAPSMLECELLQGRSVLQQARQWMSEHDAQHLA